MSALKTTLCLFASALAFLSDLKAAVSLDQSTDYLPGLKAEGRTFTVIKDTESDAVWYYVPASPRLVINKTPTGDLPEFNLMRYAFRDPSNPGGSLEGGVMQFSVSLDVADSILDELKKMIVASKKTNSTITQLSLVPLPLQSSTVAIYAPKDGTLISKDSFGSGKAPSFIGQKMAFVIPLTTQGANYYQGLMEGPTGVLVAADMTFQGLTPRLGFSVEVHWSRLFEYYSKNEKFAARASYYGLFGAQAKVDAGEIHQTLEDNKLIHITSITGANFTDADAQKYLQPILERINAELIERVKPPDKVDPATASDPSTSDLFGSVGYSVALKKQSSSVKADETIIFDHREYQNRETTCSGFVSIKGYPADQLITFAPQDQTRKVYFSLPSAVQDTSVKLKSADLTITLVKGDQPQTSDNFSWRSPDTVWKKATTDTSVIFYALSGRSGAADSDFVFKVRLTGTPIKGRSFSVAKTIDPQEITIGSSDIALSSLNDLTDKVGISSSGLAWHQLDANASLDEIVLSITSGSYSVADTIRCIYSGSSWTVPPDSAWLLPRQTEDTPIIVKLFFVDKDGNRTPWRYNGMDLRKVDEYSDLADIRLYPRDMTGATH